MSLALLLVGVLVPLAGAPSLDAAPDLWRLDASRTFTFQRSSVNEQGELDLSTRVLSIPNPWNYTPAYVVRADGARVKVGEGLKDANMSSRLPSVALSLRSSWLRTALVQGITAAVGVGITLGGMAVMIPALVYANRSLRDVDSRSLFDRPPGQLALLAIGPIGTFLGAVVAVPGLITLLVSLRATIVSVRGGIAATPDRVAVEEAWPVDVAAEVVEEHNKRVMGERQPPPSDDRLPPEPEVPAIVPS